MDRNNLLFVSQPVGFLAYNMLHPNPAWGLETHHTDGRDLQAGIQQFDILNPDDGSKGMHRLKFYDRGAQHLHQASVERIPSASGKSRWDFVKSFTPSGRPDRLLDRMKGQVTDRRTSDEAPIHAYWLPFKMNRTYEMDLGSQADFFFTAGLSGCTVVVGGNPMSPHVAHINRMDGPELELLFKKLAPRSDAEELEIQRARAMGESSPAPRPETRTPLLPNPTKAEATSRQVLLQELKALSAGRSQAQAANGENLVPSAVANLRGSNYAPRDTGAQSRRTGDAIRVGGIRDAGSHIFGVLDFEHHYKGVSDLEATANVVGHRDKATGNWHFVYQIFGSTGSKYYLREPLKCLICRERAESCVCPH